MTAYYNENDPKAAAWLRELIKCGHIASGYVDERSIEDVTPDELTGYTQCHFFAGIGVWSYALRRAGWPDDRPVWTGSCPCQSFSAAGKGDGFADERHLWPAWHHLIEQCKPPVVFGEQVEAAVRYGWLDLVQDDMEGSNYAFGAVAYPAAGIGAPHIRQRLYFVAEPAHIGHERAGLTRRWRDGLADGSGAGGVDHSTDARHDDARQYDGGSSLQSARLEQSIPTGRTGPVNGFWRDADWIGCTDGKCRAVEPGTSPLAHGAPARVGRLRGYGNAIVAPQAQAFIEAYLGDKWKH